jgi:hypothetical protein
LKLAIFLNFMCIFGGTKIHVCAIITPHLSHDQFNLWSNNVFVFRYKSFGISWYHILASLKSMFVPSPHPTHYDRFNLCIKTCICF